MSRDQQLISDLCAELIAERNVIARAICLIDDGQPATARRILRNRELDWRKPDWSTVRLAAEPEPERGDRAVGEYWPVGHPRDI